jgi:hypothetical protein
MKKTTVREKSRGRPFDFGCDGACMGDTTGLGLF